MSLADSYKKIKPSIVAFCAKYSNEKQYESYGRFPDIIGTGFIIDSCGLIMTNQHVVDQFKKLMSPKDDIDPFDRVGVVLFDVRGNEIRYPPLEIMGATKITSHIPVDDFFDREPPDLSIVGVNIRGLPSLEIEKNSAIISEGLEVGTAGFPMGARLLSQTTDGMVSQLSPTLQRGIVSAIHPWAVKEPLSFMISVLTQGGASGSPVFDTSTGRVIGVLTARHQEREFVGLFDGEGKKVVDARGNQLLSPVNHPTNYSLVVPTYLIADKISNIKKEMKESLRDTQMTLDEFYKTRTGKDFIKGEKPNNNA